MERRVIKTFILNLLSISSIKIWLEIIRVEVFKTLGSMFNGGPQIGTAEPANLFQSTETTSSGPTLPGRFHVDKLGVGHERVVDLVSQGGVVGRQGVEPRWHVHRGSAECDVHPEDKPTFRNPT